MSWSTVKQLVRYRTLFVALANAGITWIVLIIAPLGLFAVIICTALVFISSVTWGSVGDFALFRLLRPNGWDLMTMRRGSENLDSRYSSPVEQPLPQQPRRNLPE